MGDAIPGDCVLLCIRPENVTLSREGASPPTSARNALTATVRRIIPRGFYYKVELEGPCFLAAYVTGEAIEELGLGQGQRVTASFKATAVHVIRK